MNENLNLAEILKDCPKGKKLYSTVCGEVEFEEVNVGAKHPISVRINDYNIFNFTADGRLYNKFGGECVLFPSKDQRDWSKFKVKKPKFDPNTLETFNKVLVRLAKDAIWNATLFSHRNKYLRYPFITISSKNYSMCIPYNDDTKHLVGTSDEAPEFYRYWED